MRASASAILIGREAEIEEALAARRASSCTRMSRSSMRASPARNVDYANFLYERLQRNGFLFRDCQRLVNNDRNVFAACMVALGDADAVVTGLTRNFSVALDNVRRAIDQRARATARSACRWRWCAGARCSSPIPRSTNCRIAEELADIARRRPASRAASAMSRAWRFLSYSTFGYPRGERARICARGGERCSTGAMSISSMTARWPPMWRCRARRWRSIRSAA